MPATPKNLYPGHLLDDPEEALAHTPDDDPEEDNPEGRDLPAGSPYEPEVFEE